MSAEATNLAPAEALRVARGFSCVVVGLLGMAAAHAVTLFAGFSAQRMAWVMSVSCVPVGIGLRIIGSSGARRLRLWTLVVAGLSPFLAWWSQWPTQVFFAVNVALYAVALIGLLAGIHRMSSQVAECLGDFALRREALAGMGMVVGLSVCTGSALGWMFYRSGLLEAGWHPVLARLAELPMEARLLFLLPYAVTVYVTWRVQERAFRVAGGESEKS